MKRARLNGDEQDAFSKNWRRWIGALQRPGVIKKTKRRANKRERREGKRQAWDDGSWF